MKILITGANGFIGGKLVRRITDIGEFGVIAVASSEEKMIATCKNEGIDYSRILFLSNEEFLNSETELNDVYGVVHLAFARGNCPASEIASSLVYSSDVFHKLKDCNLEHIINISSQGVYGKTQEIRVENTVPAPETHYTMAKYATEALFNDIFRDSRFCTNLRLDLVAESQNVLIGICDGAKKGKIHLRGGKQVFSFISVEDVVNAIIAMLVADGEWDNIYNVGWTRKRYTLVEIADLVSMAAELQGYRRPDIDLLESEISLWAGMDASKFMKKTGWKPIIKIEEIINNMIRV